jgi:uroporphyrinogen decarboxylase
MGWEDTLELARLLERILPKDVILVGSASAVMAIPDSRNYVDFCYRMFDEPEKVDEAAARLYASGIDGAKRLRDAGVPAIKTSSDLADNGGMFFNPDQLERFIYPYLDKWAEECKRFGVRTILHTDGDVTKVLPRIVESGVNALQAIDPTAGMDLAEAKAVVGDRLCLCGNIDCGVLLNGAAEEVESLAEKTLEVGMPGGAYAFGASNAVVPETPPENYRAMIRAWERLGRY